MHRTHACWTTRATLAGLLLALLAGCQRQQPEKDGARSAKGESAVPVTLAPVKIESVQRAVDIVGTLWADEDTTIAAKVAGRVVAVHKDIGDRVASDEPLVQVSPVDYELARKQKELAAKEPLTRLGLSALPSADFDPANVPTVRRAKLQADNALAKFNRGKELHEQQPPLLSDQDYADLKTAWEVAQSNYQVELLSAQSALAMARAMAADLELATQKLQDTTVRAPAAQSTQQGRPRSYAVAGRMVSAGDYVKEGTALFRLIDDDLIKLRASVPERYIREIRVGQPVQVRVEAYDEVFTGTVARINPQVDPANRTFPIEVNIPNEKHQLKAGSFARAQVQTRVDEKVSFVPYESIVTFVGINKVFTVEADKAVEHAIELGERRGDYVEAIGKLSTNAVVVGGVSKLADGVAVTLRQTQDAAATTQTVSENP